MVRRCNASSSTEPVATAEIGTSALGASRAADEWSIVWQRLDYRSLRYIDDAGCDAGFYKIERLQFEFASPI